MLYAKEVTVAPNTPKTGYVDFTLKLTKGKVKRISVFFPWGCAGLCGVQIIHRTWQIYPLSRGEWLLGNEREFNYESIIDLTSEPYEVIIRAYNEDDTYEHHPYIAVEMTKGLVVDGFEQFMRLFGGE